MTPTRPRNTPHLSASISNSLSENELIEYGHNEFDGKDQMFAALDTIDKLAAHSEEEARMAYLNFLEVNLCGFSTEFKD